MVVGELVCKKCGYKMRSPIGGISVKCPKCSSSMHEDTGVKLNLVDKDNK
jgi:predicted Zn-ribbon and HTH transcriptional regulator